MAHNRVFLLQQSLRTSANPQTPLSLQPPPPLSSSTSFPILAISILGILTTAILLVSYYVFVIKCCLNWRQGDVLSRLTSAVTGTHERAVRTRSRRHQRVVLDDAFFAATYSVYTAPTPPRGLEEWAIRAIPIVRYKKDESSLNECAVCLGEFQDGEGLRQIPGCSHVFHIDCIDVWLQNSANCPLCRSDISASAAAQFHLIPPIHHSLTYFPSPVQDHNGDVVIDFTDRPAGDTDHPAVPAAPSPEHQQHSGSLRPLPPQKKAGPRKLHHVSSMGDECLDVRRHWRKAGDLDSSALSPVVQPIRRSISMDSSTDRNLYLAIQEILRNQRQLGDSSSGEGTSTGPAAAIAGSSRIRRSLFSFGHCRSSRSGSAVLPIQFVP